MELDSEALSQFNESIRELSETVDALSKSMSGMLNDSTGMRKSFKGLSDNAKGAADGLTKLEEEAAELEKEEKAREEKRQSDLDGALKKSISAIGKFSAVFLETTPKLNSFNGALADAGDAAMLLGAALGGPLGLAIGAVVKGITLYDQAILNQTQSLLDGKKQLVQLGSAGEITTTTLYEMAHTAGLSSGTLGKLLKPIQSLGPSIMSLGQSAGESQKQFAGIIGEGKKYTDGMMRLGITQEEQIQNTADYIALQALAGNNLQAQGKSQKEIATAANEYQENLLALSALTGKDVKSIKDQQAALADDSRQQLVTIGLTVRSQQLQKEINSAYGDHRKELEKQKQAIDNSIKGHNAMVESLGALPGEMGKGIQDFVNKGAIQTEETVALANLGLSKQLQEYQKVVKEGGDVGKASAKFQNEYVDAIKNKIATSGKDAQALTLMSDQQLKAFGLTKDSLKFVAQQMTKDAPKILAGAKTTVTKAEGPGLDKASDAQTALQAAQIATQQKFDDIVKAGNPLIGAFDGLKATVIAVNILIGGLLLGGAGKGLGALLKNVVKGGGGGGIKGLFRSGATMLEEGAGGLGKLGKFAKFASKGASKIPVIGGAISGVSAGVEEYGKTGSLGRSLMVGGITGVSSAAGGAAGALVGSAAGPVGTAVGGVAGSVAGEYGGKKLAHWLLGDKDPGVVTAKNGSGQAAPPGGPPGGKGKAVAGGGGSSMSEGDAKKMTMTNEGVRTKPYTDSLGLWTVGVGHLIGDGYKGKPAPPPEWNREFSNDEVMKLYDVDYNKHKMAASNIPGFDKLSTGGQAALTDMTFNMGPSWYKKWPNFTKKLSTGDAQAASDNLLQSTYAKQVGRRAANNAALIGNSKIQARAGGMTNGPTSGYPATLHGNEMIVPLDPTSILAELGKKSATTVSADFSKNNESMKQLISINQGMVEILSKKLDSVIDHLSSSNHTQNKILKRTSV
jgi:GH24 family phage-related lysozyme (muramidase)